MSAGRIEVDDENDGATERFSVFQPPPELAGLGKPSNTVFSESLALASVKYPNLKKSRIYLHNQRMLAQLTEPQVTAVHLIKYAHNQMFPISEARPCVRRGILIGDGPGVGKTYTLAFAIMEHFSYTRQMNQGNQKVSKESQKEKKIFKALWLTSSAQHFDKMKAALQVFDVNGMIGNKRLQITALDGKVTADDHLGKNGKKGERGRRPIHTIVLMTYATLIKGSSDKKLSSSRSKQLENWLGEANDFDGMLVFDESHYARGFARKSVTFECVVQLQTTYNNARVIYSSATAVYDIDHFGSMERLTFVRWFVR